MEHSDATKENTEWVSMWIINDGDHYFEAQARARTSAEELGEYLTITLQNAPKHSAAWHTARELAPNDYDRIDWKSISDDLLAE